MMAATQLIPTNTADLQSRFMSIMPRIGDHARFYFRDLRCAVRRADCVAEVVAMAWRWFVRLAARGKDATQFVSVLASLAARAVRAGRRCCGQVGGNDVMNPVAQRRHNFRVGSLPSPRQSLEALNEVGSQRMQDYMEERLADNTRTPPADQAAFRIDFAVWLKTLTARERRIIRAMAMNERTKDLSQKFEVSPGRISQMRRDFKIGWERFVGDEMATAQGPI